MKAVIRLLLVLLVTVPLALAAFGLVPLQGTVSQMGNVTAQVYSWIYFVPGLVMLVFATGAQFPQYRAKCLKSMREIIEAHKAKSKSFGSKLFVVAFVMSATILLLACGHTLTAIVMVSVVLVESLLFGYGQSVYANFTKAHARQLG